MDERREVKFGPEDELIIRMFLSLSQDDKKRAEGFIACLQMIPNKEEVKTA